MTATAKLSKSQKESIAEESGKFRRKLVGKYESAISGAKAETAKVNAKLREEHKATKAEAIMVGFGSIGAGVVASQVHREHVADRKRAQAEAEPGRQWPGSIFARRLAGSSLV